jgi:RNA polymerase sigma factor (sigma-70 family)
LASDCSAAGLKHIAVLFQTGTAAGLSDGALVERFRSAPVDEAEAAFTVLVQRHGPMVFSVCRRILRDRHDAEDAAQAVFLVLARQAHSIRRSDSVASWLYGVAARVASRARLDRVRRRVRERRAAEATMAFGDVDHGHRDEGEAWPELYQELGRLPERFRLPVLLCHLEGLTYEQAAKRLGCPVRTVQSRLSRARQRLRDRLARRGVAPSAAALVAALTSDPARATVCESWMNTTVAAVMSVRIIGTAAGVIPSTVASLAEGASRAMNLHRLMKRGGVVMLFGFFAGVAAVAKLAESAPQDSKVRAPAPADDNRYRAAFKRGATVEVIGVSTVPTGPHTWWKPDGTPLAEAPADTIDKKTRAGDGEEARLILLRVSGVKKDDNLRWLPTHYESYWGGRPKKNGQDAPELEYYEATFRRDRTDCEVRSKLAAGDWKTEASNDGRGATGFFVNGHKFDWGKARPYAA